MVIRKRRHDMLNPEWWTFARKTKAVFLGIAALAIAIMSLVNAADMYKQRVEIPNHYRCMTHFNDSVNGPIFKQQTIINKSTMFAMLRIQARQEATMSKAMINESDSIFKIDSVKFSKEYP
jgi:hypothetical protein